MQNFDLNLSGGIGKKWLYTAGMYQNFDPGSFKLRFTDYADRTQIYHLGLTRLLNNGKGSISLLYKKLSLGVSVVNIFNEKDAKGTISGSELITKEEAGKYAGKYMSGNYMRPFTVEFNANIKF